MRRRGVLDSQWPLIGAWALLVAIGLFVAWRFGRWARTATRALNLVAAIALLLNAWSVAGTMVTVGVGGNVVRGRPDGGASPAGSRWICPTSTT